MNLAHIIRGSENDEYMDRFSAALVTFDVRAGLEPILD